MTTIPVNPSRLDWETGDIHEAYSADRISEGKPIREPFSFGGSLWVTVSITGKALTVSGEHELKAYRLIPAQMFTGKPTRYGARTARAEDSEAARNDPNGFYSGVKVKHGGREFIMQGPPAIFVAEVVPDRPTASPEPQQLGLFGP